MDRFTSKKKTIFITFENKIVSFSVTMGRGGALTNDEQIKIKTYRDCDLSFTEKKMDRSRK